MTRPTPFEVSETTLDPGINLLEASAGTGKTFTIEGIYLRLILEEGLPVNRILVVTFTEAATDELRKRIRERMGAALLAFRSGPLSDPLLAAVRERNKGMEDRLGQRLHLALKDFDEARIYTIHGFCLRVLRENAFECGILYDTELTGEDSFLRRELVEDFWRKFFYRGHPLTTSLLLAHGADQSRYLQILREIRNQVDPALIPPREAANPEVLASALETILEKLGMKWGEQKEEIRSLLENNEALSQSRKNYHPEVVQAIVKDLDELFAKNQTSPECYLSIEKLSSSAIRSGTKPSKSKQTPAHPFFAACEEFKDLRIKVLQGMVHQFLSYAQSELPVIKARYNLHSFDDLLENVHLSLQGKTGRRLIQTLGKRYAVALIDEFQDTDPLQWAIFKRIFPDPEHRVFLIGDPKQSIYTFRGADIFTYMEAARTAHRAFTLGKNWRSLPTLVRAVNTLFTHSAQPFVFEEIQFHAAQSAEKELPPWKLGKGLDPAPLQVICPSPDGPPSTNVDQAKGIIVEDVAGEILRLLRSGTTIRGSTLEPGDIAVLVRTNQQARLMQESLRRKNVPSVLQTDSSVFESEEAAELSQLLAAILEPSNERMLRGALLSPFFGLTVQDLMEMESEAARRQDPLDEFYHYRGLWSRNGFIFLYRNFLTLRQVRSRILKRPGGERKLTNLLHLGEILNKAETGHRFGPASLFQWFQEQRTDPEARSADEYQLRVESDEKAVQLMTAHKSKGLEFPVVFCPFHWKGLASSDKKKVLAFHDPKANNRLTVALLKGSELDPALRTRAEEEDLSSEIRLLYVALTRAVYRSYLYWMPTCGGEASPLAKLLLPEGEKLDGLPGELTALESAGKGAIHVRFGISSPDTDRPFPFHPMIGETAGPQRERTFEGAIPTDAMIGSFTGMVASTSPESPDHDAVPTDLPREDTFSEAGPPDIFNFPKGLKTGLFFHDLMEHLDFSDSGGFETLIEGKLSFHGLSLPEYKSVIRRTVENVLRLPLPDPALSGNIRLETVARDHRLMETAFYFPLRSLSPAQLASPFRKHSSDRFILPQQLPDSIETLTFKPADGYMKGYIDLVFQHRERYYIVDWKTNWLGDRAEDYNPQRLAETMLRHHYFLQYHLYAIALDRFLQKRMTNYAYDTHFGGVFYLFVRGIHPRRPEHGFFFDRPAPELIESLKEALIPGNSANNRTNRIAP